MSFNLRFIIYISINFEMKHERNGMETMYCTVFNENTVSEVCLYRSWNT